MIFKVQRALASSLDEPPALVYNKDKSIVQQVPLSLELQMLLSGASKVYAHAIYHGEGRFTWGQVAEGQDW